MAKKFFKKRGIRPRAKGKAKFSFSPKVITKDGVLALFFGLFSYAILISIVIEAIKKRGETGGIIGILGVMGLVCSAISFFVSLRTLNEEYIAERIPKIALFINFFAVLIYIAIYTYGFFVGIS